MYVPSHFAESDPETLHGFVERHGFGLLVSQLDSEPFATHLPLLLDRTAGPHGTLLGHVARTNPQWREFAGRTVLAIFSGPHAYVSPTWYEAENVVPTWNYTAVHAYGRAELVEDRDGLLEIVRRTTENYEAGRPRPWVLDTSSVFVERTLSQVVGFRVPIDQLEGKFKLSQNQPAERRERVIRGLEADGGEDARGVAELIRVARPGGR